MLYFSVPVELYTVFSLSQKNCTLYFLIPKTLVKNLVKNLAQDLAKNLAEITEK